MKQIWFIRKMRSSFPNCHQHIIKVPVALGQSGGVI